MSHEVAESVDLDELKRLEQIQKNQGAIRLLRSWSDDSNENQDEDDSLEDLKRAIDSSRSSERKLFE